MNLFGGSLFTRAGADIDGIYRYTLFREWEPNARSVAWLMLNPSTADAEKLDPTLTRCADYTKQWGFGRFDVVNLFALRSTDPAGLLDVDDPIGPRNDAAILETCTAASLVICGWGANVAKRKLAGRDTAVLKLLRGVRLSALTVTEGGHPGHPLYLPKDLKPTVWRGIQ